jgi:hypothetical protein
MRAISAVFTENISALHDLVRSRSRGAEGTVFREILSGDEEHASSGCDLGPNGKVFRTDGPIPLVKGKQP